MKTHRGRLFWILLLFTFAMAISPNPPALVGRLNDKTTHMLAFATLSVAASAAFRRRSILQLFAGLTAFGALIEIVQALPQLDTSKNGPFTV